MTYEAKRIAAQQKANETGKSTCIAEDYDGYKVYVLTDKAFFSKAVQEIFEPGGKGLSPVAEVRDALEAARAEHRPHSLIASRRFWQAVAVAPGVVAWGYAYEGGSFTKEVTA